MSEANDKARIAELEAEVRELKAGLKNQHNEWTHHHARQNPQGLRGCLQERFGCWIN